MTGANDRKLTMDHYTKDFVDSMAKEHEKRLNIGPTSPDYAAYTHFALILYERKCAGIFQQ